MHNRIIIETHYQIFQFLGILEQGTARSRQIFRQCRGIPIDSEVSEDVSIAVCHDRHHCQHVSGHRCQLDCMAAMCCKAALLTI